jgi:hypothetical protein
LLTKAAVKGTGLLEDIVVGTRCYLLMRGSRKHGINEQCESQVEVSQVESCLAGCYIPHRGVKWILLQRPESLTIPAPMQLVAVPKRKEQL